MASLVYEGEVSLADAILQPAHGVWSRGHDGIKGVKGLQEIVNDVIISRAFIGGHPQNGLLRGNLASLSLLQIPRKTIVAFRLECRERVARAVIMCR